MRHMTIQLLQNSSKYYDLPQKDKTVKLPLKDISCRPTPAVSYDSNKPATYSVLVHKPGGGTPIYGLYRYVPRNRVWFLRFSVLK